MPPKKSVKADTTAASGDEAHTTNGEGKTGPTSEDWQFLMDCMKCSVGGQVAIDCQAVADIRGMKNPRSVVNRIAVVRKKLNVPLVAFNSKNSGAVANGASSPVNGAGDDEDSGASDETKPSKTGAGQKRKSPVKKDTPRKRAAKSRSLAAGKKGAASKAAKVEEETDTEEMAEGESSPLKVESDTDEVGGETGETEEVDHGGDIEMSEAEYAEWKKGKVEAN